MKVHLLLMVIKIGKIEGNVVSVLPSFRQNTYNSVQWEFVGFLCFVS